MRGRPVGKAARAWAVIGIVAACGVGATLARAAGGGRPAAASSSAALPVLNQKVLEFARGQLGKKVADGECTSLAIESLKFAGARRFGPTPGGDFVWGRPVASFEDALPGDVLQFRDAVFRGRRLVGGRRWVSWRQEYPHHTAVVAEVRERGAEVSVLHQNVGKPGADEASKRVVKQDRIRPGSLQDGGRVWIYRPVEKSTE